MQRWDELAAPFDRLAGALGCGDRELLAAIIARAGWGARRVDEPLLPSGVRHGVPWGLSVAQTRGQPAELRVFLEAQCDPPSAGGYLAAADALLAGVVDLAPARALGRGQRMWHAVGFAPDRAPAFHAYVCVPETPERAWQALGGRGEALRRELGPRARVTIVSTDLGVAAPRTKLYAIVPDALAHELPRAPAAAAGFARAMLGADHAHRRIGWLGCYAFAPGAAEPSSAALHFGAAVHGDAGTPARVAAYARALELPALAALACAPLHFVHYQQVDGAPRLTIYFLPEVAR